MKISEPAHLVYRGMCLW